MIIREFYETREDEVNLYRTYSDQNLKIRQIETGNIYEEAIDVEDSHFTYEETDEPIPVEEEKEEIKEQPKRLTPEERLQCKFERLQQKQE